MIERGKKKQSLKNNPSWHAKTNQEIFRWFQTSEKGLTNKEVKIKIKKYGPNKISKRKKSSPILNFLKQLNSPLIYILFVATIISFIFHHLIDAYVILAVILVNTVIGFAQERKAEKAIDALKKLIVAYAKVYRNGKLIKIPSQQIVPGDIIFLEQGDKVPADARLLSIKNFRTQESSLTGESFPVDKKLGVLDLTVSLGDKINMVFMGTFVVSGQAKAVVVATAEKTALGEVAESIQEIIQPKMHFNKKVSQLAVQMAVFASIGAAITFIIGYFINKLQFFEIFLFTIASLVSGIPEGLPAVLVIVLAVGARRMAKRKAIIRHLPAVETLGVTTVIATDKTGTITRNSMAVEEIITSEGSFKVTGNGWEPLGEFSKDKKAINPLKFPTLYKSLLISALSNKGNLFEKNKSYEIVGDPTEIALLVLAKKAGLDKQTLSDSVKILDDLAFSSELKFRTTLVQAKNKKQIYSVGAFETILKKSTSFLRSDKKFKLDNKIRIFFLKQAESLAKKGMRVLALAYKDVPNHVHSASSELVNNLTFVGLAGMKDPPRPEVKHAIKRARKAGIRIILKTGDHKETALAIANEIGLARKNEKALTETDLNKMTNLEFREAVKNVNIFARVTPKMKMKIIQVLQEQGEIVAMTGDGVNDAPALKIADIGISMGIIGTDVARESSEIVLADDNFSSIVDAIEEGRTVFRNVRRASFYLVTTNVAEDVTIVSSLVMGLPILMLPIHLLYLNLVTDGVNGVALAMEPAHEDVLNHPPKNKQEAILNKDLIPFLLLTAGVMILGTIPLFRHFLSQGILKAQTAAFVSMSMFQLFNVLNMRSLKSSLFKVGIFSNKWVLASLLVSFSAILGIIYLPFLSTIFKFVPLTLKEFTLIILITSSVFIFGEIYKLARHKIKKEKLK